jgi:hypothetical protein
MARGASAAQIAASDHGEPLVLRFGGSLVEQLGAQLYPSVTATVAELISNAWDAEARSVWVTMPFGRWDDDDRIVVVDDGLGMTRDDAQDAYLIVGRKRRTVGHGEMSENGIRRVHGRKGIGKLAAFGTAGILECSSVKDGIHTLFRLDYDEIRKLPPTQDYEVEPAREVSRPADARGNELAHGTRITLSRLLQKRAISRNQFTRSMSRRFAISADEMAVFINGRRLRRFDMEVQFRFPRDGVPDGVTVDEGWAVEAIGPDRQVKWWMGFTQNPLDDETLQGISVLANGKMAQRPFMFDRSRGTEGQLGQEYLVGEVQADWIDVGTEVEDDLIQSNRDQLQIEDDRLTKFVEWGQRRLAWALRQRNNLRQVAALSGFEASAELELVLRDFTGSERDRYLRLAETASRWPEQTPEGLVELMKSVVDAQADTVVRAMIEEIEDFDDALQPRMWNLVREFGLIDARRTYTIIDARLRTIAKLKQAVEAGAREVPELHTIVRDDPWLLDPRWHLLGDEVDVATLGIEYEASFDEDGLRMDFMFGLIPKSPAPPDEITVVEIKRGRDSRGREHKANDEEVSRFHNYIVDVRDRERRNHPSATVRGLMIADGYTPRADRIKASFEENQALDVRFRTWDRVIAETERMHLGWLEVTKERARAEREVAAEAADAADAAAIRSAPEPGTGAVEAEPVPARRRARRSSE